MATTRLALATRCRDGLNQPGRHGADCDAFENGQRNLGNPLRTGYAHAGVTCGCSGLRRLDASAENMTITVAVASITGRPPIW
ncbi:hypothetical protein SAMN04488020_1105 [Palleronia marisminoris]|uniref:Uncharacterized protein n=1 Tax=Palleronia marisminoris TaxID=315423 RepID=A0A1Y5TJ25_9RHOB|nr:hypothetical protein SAMN04488020_1105 [Palleronia marisminoris]SLN61491.1 hypothetical protein PAM7066_03073 [Palleronia marisminoris]